MIIEREHSLHGYVLAVATRLPGQTGLSGNLVHPLPGTAYHFPYLPIGHSGMVGK